MTLERKIIWIERGIIAAAVVGFSFVGWQIMRAGEDAIRADERAQWARAQCVRLTGPRMSEWTMTQTDGREVFLRCKFDPRGL